VVLLSAAAVTLVLGDLGRGFAFVGLSLVCTVAAVAVYASARAWRARAGRRAPTQAGGSRGPDEI
jgi:hypothetical protein